MGVGLFFWFGLAVAVGVWASNRGRHGFGWFLLACVISPILAGVFLAVTKNFEKAKPAIEVPTDATHVRCGLCAEFVLPEAVKCKHCGAGLTPDHQFRQKTAQVLKEKEGEDSKNLLIGIGAIVVLIVLVKLISMATT